MKKSTQEFVCSSRKKPRHNRSFSVFKLTQFKSFFLFFCLLAYTSISLGNNPSETTVWKSPMMDDGKRYLALMFTNDSEDDQYLDVIENAHSKGFNALYLTVRMDAVKCHNQGCVIGSSINPNWNPTNRSWTQTDAQIAKAKQLGMKIGIRVHLGNSDFGGNMRSTYLWGPGRLAADQNGNTVLGGYNFSAFTFSSQPAVDSAKSFVQEVMNRYGYLEGEGNLIFVSFSYTSSQEMEYPGPGGVPTDYSNAAKNEYASWYLTNYGVPNPNVPTDFTSTEGKKWYKFRHCKLKDVVGQLAGVVRNHNSNIKVIQDVGSAFDPMSARRGTFGFKSLAAQLDGFKVNDDFHYDHRFSMDILRGSLPGKLVMNEAFLVGSYPSGFYSSFATDVFKHGGKLLSVVTVNNGVINQYAGDWSTISSTWLAGANGNMTPVNANGTVNYTFNEILNASFNGNGFSTSSRNIYGEWQTQYNSNPSNGKPVNVVLDDSELNCGAQPSCAFALTAGNSNANPAPGAPVNLTFNCTGGDCGAATFTWSGNGISGNQNPKSITAPNTPGTYVYQIAANKTGCPQQTATTSITVGTPPSGGCVVNKVRLYFRDAGQCCMSRLVGAKIQGSNNGGSTWTDIYTFSSNGNGSFQDFSFSNTTSYSSARFVASATGWGELRELEFYNGTTKLSGTTFGTDNYANAFDGNTATEWHAVSAPGPANYAGMNFTGCTPANCDFNVTASASPSTVSTSDPVQLNYVCTGANCNTASFAWSGQSISGNQNPKSITAPATAGNYTYTITATKSGCTTKTANASLTVNPPSGTGCIVNKVRFKFRHTGECCMSRLPGAKIQGSNNGTTWTDLYTFTTNGTGSWQEFSFSNTTAYSSVRFQASSSGWGELYELEFYKGTAKLTGTPFGIDNYANAFDGDINTQWHVASNPGTNNYAGLSNLGNCSGSPLMLDSNNPDVITRKTELAIFPNPSNGTFQTSFYLENGGKATISITDLQGRIIYNQQFAGKGLHKETINLTNKASGTMMLRLITDKGTEVKRFNVVR